MSVGRQSDTKLRQNLEEVISALRKHNTSLEADLEKTSNEVLEYKTRIILVRHVFRSDAVKLPVMCTWNFNLNLKSASLQSLLG